MTEIPHSPSPTVGEVRRRALPLGVRILSGGDQLDRPVRWAVTVSGGNSLPYLERDELLLVRPGKLSEEWVQSATAGGIAGLITLDPLDPLPLSVAQLAGLPVLQLPAGSQLGEIERAITAFLLGHGDERDRRGLAIYQQLVRMITDQQNLDAVLNRLAVLIDKTVIVQDKRLRVQHSAPAPRFIGDHSVIETAVAQRDSLPATFQDRHKLPMNTTPILRQPVPRTTYIRLVTPIVTQNIGRGFLSFIAAPSDFDDLDDVIIQHSAVICALEMARAKAISEVEKKLRGDFLDNLISGIISDPEAMADGDRYGFEMSHPRIAMVVRWQGPSQQHPSVRRLETLVNGLALRHPNLFLSRLRDMEVRLFVKGDGTPGINTVRGLAAELQAEAATEYRNAALAVGIGTSVDKVSEWRISHDQARQACTLAIALKSKTALYIGDLGIYTFLMRTEFHAELNRLRDATIGKLLDYEKNQRGDLLLTLESFFQAHGNISQTAELLNIHRNTLSYRMERIQDITQLDLNQPDVRLAVHLALKIHRLVGSSETR